MALLWLKVCSVLVTISAEQLKSILEVHGDWLASEGEEGKKSSLYEANPQKLMLKGLICAETTCAKPMSMVLTSVVPT